MTKIGLILTPNEALNLFSVINKLTSTKCKDVLLRLLHGELYSKERLFRYQLVDAPTCPRCDEIETLSHKYIECDYVKEIWRRTFQLKDKLRISTGNDTLLERIFCSNEPNLSILTVHSEILNRIRYLNPSSNFLTLPVIIARNATAKIARIETKQEVKEALYNLLQG